MPAFLLALTAVTTAGQESLLPRPERRPTLWLDPGGPAATVTTLAFGADGRTLYVAGLDKSIRVYRDRGESWQPDTPLRLPVGPGDAGAVNALAVSDDGRWLAAAGRAPMRDEAWVSTSAWIIPADKLSAENRRDRGVIYLFDLANPVGGRVLRGHLAAIRGLAFAAGTAILVSAAVEPGDESKPTGIVRVWDAVAGTELAKRGGFPTTNTLPSLAAWPTGAGKRDLAVAVAWPDADPKAGGRFRVWNVATNGLSQYEDGAFNLALAVLRGKDGNPARLLTGGFADFGAAANQHGQITVRDLAGGKQHAFDFPPAQRTHFLPRAAAEARDAVALILERSGAARVEPAADLTLLNPDTGAVIVSQPLTRFDPVYARLAASPNGDVLAVAGFRDHHIELYPTADLARGAKPVVLAGGPPGFAGVRFLDEGSALGLATIDGGELFFDFAKRTVGSDRVRRPDGAAAAAAVEKLPSDDRNRGGIRVTGAGVDATCRLDPGAVPTVWAFRPVRPVLIAVASEEPGQGKTQITLYDANGRALKHFLGHLGRVRGLAFSAAKPLLASVAADGTVRVWSLTDLDRQPGVIDGLILAERGGALVVDTPLGRLLAAGDMIEAAGGGDKPTPVKTVAEFARAWWAAPVEVGGTFPVRVRGRNQPVALPVVAGAEARKPLFTLWVDADRRDWVGWSPAGPYDASGPAAEARIGWLTNTGNPAAPATFAAAAEYRDTYFRKDLLKFLAERGELASALDAWEDAVAPPPPQIAVRLREPGVVRLGRATLDADLVNLAADYPLAKAIVRYRVRPPEGPATEWVTVPAAGRRPWAFDVSAIVTRRGAYTAEVELLRREGGPVVASEVAEFVAAPPPPALALTAGGVAVDPKTPVEKRVVVMTKPTVRLAVTKAVGHDSEAITVTVNDGATERTIAPAADGSFPPLDLPLTRSETTVIVRAVPTNATRSTRAAETTEVSVAVRYDPPAPEPTPGIEPIAFAPAGEPFRLGDREVIAVGVPKVTASAKIAAKHPLAKVEVAVGDAKPAALDAGGTKEFSARHELALKPGAPVRITFTAATANSPPGERAAVVAYLPFPAAPRSAPLAAASVTDANLVVSGTIDRPAEGETVTLRVVVSAPGREPRSFDARFDTRAGTWSAGVVLFPGSNRLSVVARNAWRERTADAGTVAFRRPPRIVSAKDADAGTKAVADLVLTAETPEGLEPRELLVGGRPVTTRAPKRTAAADGRVTWEVTAADVPVKGLDRLSLSVRNADGESLPVVVAVKRTAPPRIDPPRIIIGDLPRDAAVEDAAVAIPFRVVSKASLLRVEVWHRAGSAGEYEKLPGFTPDPAVKTGDTFTLDARPVVPLVEGANRIRLVAVNEGGPAQDEFAVTRTVPPVQIAIEGLDVLDRVGASARSLAKAAGGPLLRFADANTGAVAVRGSIRWADPNDPAASDPGLTAALSVNRVGQLPVPLEPAASGVRKFRAPVFLNDAENIVRLSVRAAGQDRSLPLATGAERVFAVHCAAPLARQRLHVVVVGVNAEPEEAARKELARRAVRALGGTASTSFEAGAFAAPGFEQAFLYRPEVGSNVEAGHIRLALEDVARGIRGLAAAAPPDDWVNDVVLIYYQGRDFVDDRDGRRWLHTSRSMKYPPAVRRNFAVAVNDLPDTAGVRLLLLSVVAPPEKVRVAADAGVPLLRYAWADPEGPDRLLPLFGQALADRVRLGDVADDAGRLFRRDPGRAGDPLESLDPEVRKRPVGRGKP
jgi:WD40 repeat protein